MKQTWPAAERNKQPILDVLRRVLPARGTLLEIASGTGQHAAFFAEQLAELVYQPSETDPQALLSIAAWVEETGLPNLRPPLTLDVSSHDWGIEPVDAIFNANMIHIAPWAVAEALLSGVGRYLKTGGVFVLYGPFHIGGQPTSASNAEFDASLKARNASWGVRDLEAVVALATAAGLTLTERVQMPANNQLLVFRRG